MNEDNRTIALMAASIYGGFLARPDIGHRPGVTSTMEDTIKGSVYIASEIYNRCNKSYPIHVQHGDGTDTGCRYSER